MTLTPLEKSQIFRDLCEPTVAKPFDGIQVMAALMSKRFSINHDMNKVCFKKLNETGVFKERDSEDVFKLSNKLEGMIREKKNPKKDWSERSWGVLEVALALVKIAETSNAIDHLPEA